MDAVVYTSNTGYTKQYAELLAAQIKLPIYSLDEAKEKLVGGEEIIYLGWLLAGSIKGYKKAAKKYGIKAVCAVGMSADEKQLADVRERNNLPENLPSFALQGGFDIEKLRGIYKFMMKCVRKIAAKGLEKKAELTPDERDMLDLMQHGGSRVSLENLSQVIEWYRENAEG